MRLYWLFCCLLGLVACGQEGQEDEAAALLRGKWIGSAETVPYPELMTLSYDSVPIVQCFYRGIDLYIPENFRVKGNQLSFRIDAKGLQGDFTGRILGDTIKGIFQTEQGMHASHFIKAHPNTLESVGQLVGYYRLGPDHVLEVLPYTLSSDLTGLSIIDFKTGKKRVAFPVGEGYFAAGKRMLSPYPRDLSLRLAGTDSRQNPGIEYEDGGALQKAKRLPDVENFRDFEVQHGDIKLACTITYPMGGEGPYPLVVVVPGTGEVVRASAYNDYTKVLPWQGVAVLAYDKRGCGESTGDLDRSTFEDLAKDLDAVLQEVYGKPGEYNIDAARVGISGFDQAGFVMPIVASKRKQLAFMATIAGSALSVEAQEFIACELRMLADGFDEPAINEALQYERRMFEYLQGKIDSATFQRYSDEAKNKPWMGVYATSFDNKRYIERWKLIHAFDPLPYLNKVKVPMFVAYGEQDLICPPKYNFPVMKQVFERNAHEANQMIAFEGANHLIMLGEKRGDFQFSEIIGYAPSFMPAINAWMLQRLGVPSADIPEVE